MQSMVKSIFFLFLFAGQFGNLLAQENTITGKWSGKLQLPGMKLEMIFKITRVENGTLEGKLDVPQQGAVNLPAEETKFINDSLIIEIPRISGTYSGKMFSADSITGKWEQGGLSIDLNLKRTGDIKPLKRPQTPIPPFPYLSEEVEYTNPVSTLKLAGTLTIPKNARNCPAVVMITGSGAEDRDETVFGHKPFAVIADYLSRNGIAVLRADDRGVGGSEGDVSSSTSQDFATDALAGVQFLKNKKEIDSKKIGLIGHSEGGLIAPIAANESSDVAFIVLMAGLGTPGEQILYEQSELSMRASGMPEFAIEQTHFLQKTIIEVLKNEPDSTKASELLRKNLSQGMYDTMNDNLKNALDQQIKSFNNTWFRFLLTYDPLPALKKVKCPVLAINGTKDVQVPVSNLSEIYTAVSSGGNMQVDTVRFENHNHLFQICEAGAISEYSEIDQTIDPEVLKTMKDWILKTTSK